MQDDKIKFQDAFSHNLGVYLNRGGCHIHGGPNTLLGDDRSAAWASIVSSALIASEPSLLSPLNWQITSEKYGFLALRGTNEDARVEQRFLIKTMARPQISKSSTFLLNQVEIDGTSSQTTESIYREWSQEVKQGRIDWKDIPEAKTSKWANSFLQSQLQQLRSSGASGETALIRSLLGEQDAYFVFKAPRQPLLGITFLSLAGRSGELLRMKLKEGALIQDNFGVRLDIPLTNGCSLIGQVHDTRHALGLALKMDWAISFNIKDAKIQATL